VEYLYFMQSDYTSKGVTALRETAIITVMRMLRAYLVTLLVKSLPPSVEFITIVYNIIIR